MRNAESIPDWEINIAFNIHHSKFVIRRGSGAVRRHCHDVVSLLADFIERQLPREVQVDLERHLAKCPRCVAQLKTYESTVSLLRSVKEDDLPPELRCTLKAFIDRNCQN
jgi:hypothetical protein